MTRAQLEFIRVHGVTRCPPGPMFRMSWGSRRRRRGLPEQGEQDMIDQMCEGSDYLSLPQKFQAAKLRREEERRNQHSERKESGAAEAAPDNFSSIPTAGVHQR
jgi:hypothetical protein